MTLLNLLIRSNSSCSRFFFRVCECKILWSMNRDGFTSSLLSWIPLAYFSCLLTLDPSEQCWIEQPFLSYLLLWSQRKWIYLIFIIQNVVNYSFHCCSLPSWRSFSPFPFFFSLYQISISNVFPPHLVRWSCGIFISFGPGSCYVVQASLIFLASSNLLASLLSSWAYVHGPLCPESLSFLKSYVGMVCCFLWFLDFKNNLAFWG